MLRSQLHTFWYTVDMTKQDIINKVKSLNLPENSYVVYGSAPLAAVGFREANDIDMLVSHDVYESLKSQGWVPLDKGENDFPITKDVFELHEKWLFGAYHPTLEQLLSRADFFDGVPFASLEDVLKWKEGSGYPKHNKDIAWLRQHLGKD